MPGLSTAADNILASSIRPKRQARQVHRISLYFYNNAAAIYFSHHSYYTYPLTTGLVFVSHFFLN